MLATYNDVIPDGADRTLRMAEEQSRHRMELERKVIGSDTLRSYLGLAAGLIVALAVLYVSREVILAGYQFAGTFLATVDLAGLVGVFIYGNESRRRERTQKARMMLGQQLETRPSGY